MSDIKPYLISISDNEINELKERLNESESYENVMYKEDIEKMEELLKLQEKP